jgi:hypothetical protein
MSRHRDDRDRTLSNGSLQLPAASILPDSSSSNAPSDVPQQQVRCPPWARKRMPRSRTGDRGAHIIRKGVIAGLGNNNLSDGFYVR